MKDSDQWETPQWLFDELNEEFHFDIDICATANNRKCAAWYTDYLKNEFNFVEGGIYEDLRTLEDICYVNNRVCFMNPPYSNPLPFIQKAWEDSKHCKIVLLIKCDTSTNAWATFWNYKDYGPKPGCEVRFLSKRLKFERNGVPGKYSAAFPSAIIIIDRRGL